MATITLSGPVPDPTLTWELRAHVAERDNIRLLAAVREAKAALEPFGAKATAWEERHPAGRYPFRDGHQITHRLGDFRRARTALARLGELGDE